jgi:hypothetical protein
MPADHEPEAFGQFFTAGETARRLSIDGRHVAERTVRRWFDRGILRATKLGGRRVCCVKWLAEFIEGGGEADVSPKGRTPVRREKAIRTATEELARAGI